MLAFCSINGRSLTVNVATLERVLLARVEEVLRCTPSSDLTSFVSHSIASTVNSIGHVSTAVDDAVDAAHTLEHAFDRFEARRDANRLCTEQWRGIPICPSLMELLHRRLAVSMIRADLLTLGATLQTAAQDLSSFVQAPSACPSRLAEALLRAEVVVLWDALRHLQIGRTRVEEELFGDGDGY